MLGEDEWQGTCTTGFSESHSSFEAVRMCPRAVETQIELQNLLLLSLSIELEPVSK